MRVEKLPLQSQAAIAGYTHQVVITHEDFTSTGNTQTLTIAVANGNSVGKAFHVLNEAFDSSDATLISLTYTVGETDVDRFLTSTQIAEDDASEVFYKAGATTSPFVFTSADTVDFAFTGTAAKDLSTLNQGKLTLFLQLIDWTELEI